MPVISTLGALTYSKISISTGTDWRYWNLLIKNSNTSLSAQINDTIFDSTTQYIYGVGYVEQPTNNYYPLLLKINNTANSYTQPNIDWITRKTNFNFANVTFVAFINEPSKLTLINGDSNLIVTGRSIVSPLSQEPQINYDISPLTGNVNFAKLYAARPAGNGGTGTGIYRYAEDLTFDSSNNYYTIGWVNQQVNNGVGNVNVRLNISKFNGTSGNLITTKSFGLVPNVNVNITGTFFNCINMDNTSNNLIITGQVPNATSYSIANISSDLTTINWQKWFTNTFSPENSTVVDSNSYVVGAKTSNGSTRYAIVKVDSTGNVVWSKETSNSNSSITSIQVNNSNTSQIIVAGKYSNANTNSTVISSIDTNNGNIIWQTSLNYVGANYFWSNAEFNIYSISSTNNQILLSGSIKSQTGGHYTGCVVTLPTNGTIPGDGLTTLEPNLTLTIASGNFFSLSNSNITVTTSNYSLNIPLNSEFINGTVTSNSNTLTTTSFINLA